MTKIFRGVLTFIFAIMLLSSCGKNGGSTSSADNLSDRLVLSSMDYRSSGHDFKVDRNLNLKIYRHYQFHAQVQSRSINVGSNIPETLTNAVVGDYILRVLILPEDSSQSPQKDAYLSSDKQKVHIEDGILDVQVTFPFSFGEQPMLMSRSRMVVELYAADPTIPQGVSAGAVFDPLSDSGHLLFYKNKISIDQETDKLLSETKFTKANIETDASTMHLDTELKPQGNLKDFFERKFNLNVLNHERVIREGFEEADLKTLIANGPQNLRTRAIEQKFCALFFKSDINPLESWWQRSLQSAKIKDNDLEACKKNPRDKLRFIPTQHVENVLGDPEVVSADSPYVTLAVQDFFEEGSGDEEIDGNKNLRNVYNNSSTAARVDFSLGLNVFGNGVTVDGNVMNETGVRFGREWYHLKQHTKRSNVGRRSSYTVNRNLQIEEWKLQFKADINSCLLVTPKIVDPSIQDPEVKIVPAHVCMHETTNQFVTENWYFLYQTPLNSALQTTRSRDAQGERLVSMTVRGANHFRSIMDLISNLSPDMDLILKHVPRLDQNAREGVPTATDGSFPGLLSQ